MLFSKASRLALGPSWLPVQCVSGTDPQGSEADHSSLCRGWVRNGLPAPPYPVIASIGTTSPSLTRPSPYHDIQLLEPQYCMKNLNKNTTQG